MKEIIASIRDGLFDFRNAKGFSETVAPHHDHAHGVLFWIGNTFLTPLIMLISLFSNRKRLLHDMLLGVVVVRSDSF